MRNRETYSNREGISDCKGGLAYHYNQEMVNRNRKRILPDIVQLLANDKINCGQGSS